MGKPAFCMCNNKGTFILATWIVQFLYCVNPKFPASIHLLYLYSSVFVGPRWFVHDLAQFWISTLIFRKPVSNVIDKAKVIDRGPLRATVQVNNLKYIATKCTFGHSDGTSRKLQKAGKSCNECFVNNAEYVMFEH